MATTELTRAAHIELRSDHSGASGDAELVRLWVSTRLSERTQREYTRDAKFFLDYLSDIRANLRNLTVRDVDQYLQCLTGSAATVARKLASMKSLLTFAQETGYIHVNVGKVFTIRMPPNQLAERTLTEEEVIRMITACSDLRDRTLLRLLYVSGARVSEIAALDWKHMHAKDDGIVVTLHGKGNKTRHALLTATVAGELAALRCDAKDDEPIFVSKYGKRLGTRGIQRVVHKLAKKSGLTRVDPSPHWLRHAHASHALEHGAPIQLVQATLGHKDVSTTGKYLHARPGDGSARYLIA